MIEGLACELIGWSARALRVGALDAPWVRRVREVLHDRFADPPALSDLAREVGVRLTTLDETPELDLDVDGADEIGPGLARAGGV